MQLASRHPLVGHVSVNSLQRYSSSNVRDNVGMSLNIDSSFVSNDEVIREISYHGDFKEKNLFESKVVLSKCFCIITVKNNF